MLSTKLCAISFVHEKLLVEISKDVVEGLAPSCSGTACDGPTN
jgi:hypothetical protein